MVQPKRGKSTGVVAAAALITGSLVGAGILGLPINTGLAGLWPSLPAILAGGALMYLTAMILGDQAIKSHSATFDFPSLYESLLGRTGKWIAVAANLLMLYGLLTAFFSGGATIVAKLVGMESHPTLVLLLFAVPLSVLTSINLGFIQKLNTLFILVLLGTFALLLFMGVGHIHPGRMAYTDWSYLPSTLPIIVAAFYFHNIIPTVTAELEWDRARYRKAVTWGMVLALFLNVSWVVVGIGVLPLAGENSLLSSWETNLPATVPMEFQLKSRLFTFCASIFALVAICTSFLGMGLGLKGFVHDLLANTFKINSRPLVIACTFLPPLLTALVYPDIFLKALDIVGGVGIVLLFGLLPCLIVLRDRSQSKRLRLVCAAACLLALAILAMEIMQETGMLKLHPRVEYHKVDF